MRQQTLAAQTGFEKYGRKSKRERFLEEMEQIVPWAGVTGAGGAALSEGRERAASGRAEHHVAGVLLQQWFNLSDPGAEDALYESPGLQLPPFIVVCYTSSGLGIAVFGMNLLATLLAFVPDSAHFCLLR